jgi:hypothetical protein
MQGPVHGARLVIAHVASAIVDVTPAIVDVASA